MDQRLIPFMQAHSALQECDSLEEIDILLKSMNMAGVVELGFMNPGVAALALAETGFQTQWHTATLMYDIGEDYYSTALHDYCFVDINHPEYSWPFSVHPNNKEGLAPVRNAAINSFCQCSVIVCPEEE